MTNFKTKTSAVDWIGTYENLDDYIARCRDDDDLHLLARSMAEDSVASGYGVDVGAVMEALINRRRATIGGLKVEEAALER